MNHHHRKGKGSYLRVILLTVLGGGTLLFTTLHGIASLEKYSPLLDLLDDEEDIATITKPLLRTDHNTTEFGPVIHIIQTRFMQFQPNLTELGLARALLFETFCLPTLLRQSSQNYLWMIRTDPFLDDAVLQRFIALVQPYPNIYLIASNYNPEGFRSKTFLAATTEEQVWSGDYQLLVRSHRAAKTRIVLESRLDADDGLYTDFVKNLQKEAVNYLDQKRNSWKLWCSDEHLDWQLFSPVKSFDPKSGVLVRVKSPLCVTPGLTVGYGLDAVRRDFPGGQHQLLHKQIAPCKEGNGRVKCLSRFPKSKFSAVRARTVTSTAMGNVVLESTENEKLSGEEIQAREKGQNKLWLKAKNLFGISKEHATNTRRIFTEKLDTIASENLKGQCAKGFTCKDSSRAKLQNVATKKIGEITK